MSRINAQQSAAERAGVGPPSKEDADQSTVLGAVREDIRQTLRVGWIDPALEAAASHPLFFTAAWSGVRPNVGKTFVLLARSVRNLAAEAAKNAMRPADLRQRLDGQLAPEEVVRFEECVRAAHLAAAKAQIVVHAFYRAVRRDRIRGTGREEPPIRRGVPDWQRWMSIQPAPEPARPTLDEAARSLGLPAAPAALRLIARWPPALEAAWTEVKRFVGTEAWESEAARLRRAVLGGIQSLPHPMELQWPALKGKGFTDADREALTKALAVHDASMPWQTLAAALLWAAVGAPDVGSEG